MGITKIAEDVYHNNLQFTHLDATAAFNLTSANSPNSSIAANSDKFVVITPLSGEAYVNIGKSITGTPSAGTSAGNVGILIKLGASYTTILRRGDKISVSATCNICPLGEE